LTKKVGAIFGIFGEGSPGEVERMGERLKHRGRAIIAWSPSDDVLFGLRCDPAAEAGCVTPSAPILFDGCLNNIDALAASLHPKTDFSGCIGDLIFDLYRAFGAQGFRRISGQFSLALWDAPQKKLILACDFGTIRALYFTWNHGRFLFASEYKALLALDSVRAEPNREAIQYLQCTKYMMPGKCCLENIQAVAGGTWVESDRRKTSIHRYQDFGIHVRDRSDALHARSVKQNLIASARRQVHEYDPIGISLSSGLDSTLTVAAVREAAPEKTLHAFTAGVTADDRVFEEAAEVARLFHADHHQVVFDVAELPQLIPPVVWFMEDPIGREEKFFYYIIAREAKKFVPLLLAGHNADSLFGGMPRHVILKVIAKLPFGRGPLQEFYNFTQLGEPPRTQAGKALVAVYSKGNPIWPPRVMGIDQMPSGSDITRSSSQPLSDFLREAQLSGANANSAIEKLHAANQIVFNSPFMDTDFIRSSFEIPDRLKIRGFRRKYVLHKAFCDSLPSKMVWRKKGFLRLAHDKRFSDVIEGMASDYLSPSAVKSRRLFDYRDVGPIVKRANRGGYSTEQLYRIWSLILIEAWARIFLDRRGECRRSG
jgi:asparagine synthase (glutamine-hydrolysing)